MEHIASAFASIAQARAVEVAGARFVGCGTVRCKAERMGGDWGWDACRELRREGTCPVRAFYGLGPAAAVVVGE